jgi:hypothetical protein
VKLYFIAPSVHAWNVTGRPLPLKEGMYGTGYRHTTNAWNITGRPLPLRLATGWTIRGSNPDGGEIFRSHPDRPWGPHSILYNGYRVSFPGVKRPERGASHPIPFSCRGSRKGRAIPLLPPLRPAGPVIG